MSSLFKVSSRRTLFRPHSSLPKPSSSSIFRHSSNATAAVASKLNLNSSIRQPPPIFSGESLTNSSLLKNYPITQLTTLSNGLRVATEQGTGETATIGVWIDTGSRYESAENNGVAHFLEHLLFKGTSTRNRVQLEQEFENMGGHLNAYTSREQTTYYARIFSKDLEKTMEILSDVLLNSKISEADVDNERDTILREMEEVEGNMEEAIFDRLHHTAYRGTSLSRTILGPVENIQRIKSEDIKTYIKRHYTAPRMVLSGAGGIEHSKLVSLAEKYFSKIPTSPPAGQEPFMEPAVFTGSDIIARYDDMQLAHIAVAFPTAGWCDPDNFPLMALQNMLGNWEKHCYHGMFSASEMVSAMAKWELCESVSTFNTQYSDTGLFGVYIVCKPTDCNNASAAVMKAISALCYRIEEHQLQQAKNMMKLQLLNHLDSSSTIAEDIGRQILTFGRRLHPSEVLARIDALDTNAVKAAANRFFFDRDHALAAIGPVHELPDYNWFRSRSYFVRF